MNSKGSLRCVCCDSLYSAKWDGEQFDKLCPDCVTSVYYAVEDSDQVSTLYVEAHKPLSDSMLADDPYYEFGEDSMGQLNLFESYE